MKKKYLVLLLIPLLIAFAGCGKKKRYVAPPPAPSAPSNLTGTAVSSTQINLSWKDNSTNERGFYVYRRITGNYARVAIMEANATSYSDNGLNPETTYWYKVTAYNDGGESGSSNKVSITTSPGPLPPLEAPSNLSANIVSYKQINLSWEDNSNIEDGFRVCCDMGGNQYQIVDTLPANTTSFEHYDLQPMIKYTYYVQAYRGDEYANSREVSATTTCPVEILNSRIYPFSNWGIAIAADLKNNATELCEVEITATFYDSNGIEYGSRAETFILAGGENRTITISYSRHQQFVMPGYSLQITKAKIIY